MRYQSYALTTLFSYLLYVRYPGKRLVEFLTFAAAIALLLSTFLVVFVRAPASMSSSRTRGVGLSVSATIAQWFAHCFWLWGYTIRTRSLADQITRGIVLLLSVIFIVMSGSAAPGWGTYSHWPSH